MKSSKPYVIGIAGVTCSGKTLLAEFLKEMFGEMRPVVVHADSYYRDLSSMEASERARRNFDLPEAIESELLGSQLMALSAGQVVSGPVYDFATHTRSRRRISLGPADLVIVEGLFVLYWEEVRRLCRTKVFVDLPTEVSLSRRLERDIAERGRTPDSVLRQYRQTVGPMNEKAVIPTKAFADLVVSGSDPVEISASAVADHMESSFVGTDK